MRNSIIFLLLTFCFSVSAQIKLTELPTDTVVTSNDKVMSYGNISGTPTLRTLPFESQKRYFSPNVVATPINYIPTTVGAYSDRGKIVQDTNNDVWYIDGDRNAVLIRDSVYISNDTLFWNDYNIVLPVSFTDSTRLTQDSILVYYQDGLEVGRDTITGTGGGACTETLTTLSDNATQDSVIYVNENGDRYAVYKGNATSKGVFESSETSLYVQATDEKSRILWEDFDYNGVVRLIATEANGSTTQGQLIVEYVFRNTSGTLTQEKTVLKNTIRSTSTIAPGDITWNASDSLYLDIYGTNGTIGAVVIYDIKLEFVEGSASSNINNIVNSVQWVQNITHADGLPNIHYQQIPSTTPEYATHALAEADGNLIARAMYQITNDRTLYIKP